MLFYVSRDKLVTHDEVVHSRFRDDVIRVRFRGLSNKDHGNALHRVQRRESPRSF